MGNEGRFTFEYLDPTSTIWYWLQLRSKTGSGLFSISDTAKKGDILVPFKPMGVLSLIGMGLGFHPLSWKNGLRLGHPFLRLNYKPHLLPHTTCAAYSCLKYDIMLKQVTESIFIWLGERGENLKHLYLNSPLANVIAER